MEVVKTKLAIRRQGDPYYVQRIWDAIKICREDRKASTSLKYILIHTMMAQPMPSSCAISLSNS